MPPVAAEAAGIAMVPTKTAVNAGTPTRPKGRSVRMNSPPVMHATNLILPAIVDVGHTTSINIGPRRTIADGDVIPDIDLPDIHPPIVNDVVSNVISNVGAITNSVTDAGSISNSITNTRTIANSVANARTNRPRQRRRTQIVHSQEIPNVTGGWPTAIAWKIRTISHSRQVHVGTVCCATTQTGNAGTVLGTIGQFVTWIAALTGQLVARQCRWE